MIQSYRQAFNVAFTDDRYQEFLFRLSRECGTPVAFRVAETPCFLPRSLVETLARYGREMVGQILDNPAYREAARATVPEWYRVPNEADRPLFVQADFGLDAHHEPKLVEIQGFPSLYAFQPALSGTYRDVYGIDPELPRFLSGLTEDAYHETISRAIVGEHDPENVVLLEVQPFLQKTLPDFLLTERYYGVTPVCVSEVRKEGKRLLYRRENRWVPIERIYNRVIAEELAGAKITPGFDFRDDLEVEWAGHPSWYFELSKFSLPYLRHPAVPETHFLHEMSVLPDDLENWVLKPLFSFAGHGVKIGPTREDIAAIADPTEFVLQRRVSFAPTIATPDGPTKVEIRVMFVFLEEMLPVSVLLRMGRGKQMGVDHNRDLAWVGASAGFLVEG